MDRAVNPVFRSLNRPLLLMGVERKLFFFILILSVALFVAFGNLITSFVVFFSAWMGARTATQRDSQFLRIALNSRRFGLRYDPAKFLSMHMEDH